LQFAISKRGDQGVGAEPEFVQIGNKIIGSSRWVGAYSNTRERCVLLTVEAGRIVDMQGGRSRREAERLARRQ
jgi:hypothetical protein